MKRTGLVAVASVLFATLISGAPPTVQWFTFNKAFITSHYAADSAIGSLTATNWVRAKTPHSISCGGQDGELHIGSFEYELDVPQGQRPVSSSTGIEDEDWGVVYELPNARHGNGPAVLDTIAGRPTTFHGYFRVWNEGHGAGQVWPSNPHHVLEVHPAWGFASGAVQFDRPDLIGAISGYRGYGIPKFRPIVQAFAQQRWPRAYQQGERVSVLLGRAENFYQFPVAVRSVRAVTGGEELRLDVYSTAAYTTTVYEGLRAIVAAGSALAGTFTVGERQTVLGFFSVNLRVALERSSGASSADSSVFVPEVLEFFVFGPTTRPAVSSCSP